MAGTDNATQRERCVKTIILHAKQYPNWSSIDSRFNGGSPLHIVADKVQLLGCCDSLLGAGADVNLRVNSSMMVRVASTRDDALATVDSADFRSGIKYKLQWKRCNGQAPADSFGHWN